MLRRWRAAWPKRSKRYDPAWAQGPQTQPFPGVYKPAGPRPLRFPARPRRGRYIEPTWPQSSQATPNPALYDQAGARPRLAPRLRRGHFHEPVWPQGSTATPPPAVHRGAGPRPLRFPPLPRRGHFTEPPWPATPPPPVPPGFLRAARRPTPRTRPGHTFAPSPIPSNPWVPAPCTPRRPRATAVRRGAYPPVPVTAPLAWTPDYLRTRRPAVIVAPRHHGAPLPPAYVPPGPTRVIAVTAARAVIRWSATEGRTSWAARTIVRWNGREGGNR